MHTIVHVHESVCERECVCVYVYVLYVGSQSANSRERCVVKCVTDGLLAGEAMQCIVSKNNSYVRDHTGVKVSILFLDVVGVAYVTV